MDICKQCYQPYKNKVVNATTLCEKCKRAGYKHFIAKKEVWTVQEGGSDYEPMNNDSDCLVTSIDSSRVYLHKDVGRL